MKSQFFLNQTARRSESALPRPTRAPLAFHRRLPGYQPTPLIDAPELARRLGIGQVLVKDESKRLGLPAFKILGASWAVYRTLEKRAAMEGSAGGRGRCLASVTAAHPGHAEACPSGVFEPWSTVAELAERLAALKPLTLVTATDGNHGRGVAHVAALFGFAARIFVPAGTAQARIDGITSEGAIVRVVDGTYDDAVACAAREADERCLVISDTSWPGYEEIPRWVMEGYSTILWEIDDELARRGEKDPDLFPVPFGVGALAAAVVRHYEGREPKERPKLLSVEPLQAACMLAAMEAGEIVTVPGPHDSIMAGLNCGRVSIAAWPIVSNGIDAFIAIPDERAREAMRALARVGIVAGETGAAGLAGLIELLTSDAAAAHREALSIDKKSRALVLVTEGATDPTAYERVVGKRPQA
jgi:diaminopropionate ammonia-lyase